MREEDQVPATIRRPEGRPGLGLHKHRWEWSVETRNVCGGCPVRGEGTQGHGDSLVRGGVLSDGPSAPMHRRGLFSHLFPGRS